MQEAPRRFGDQGGDGFAGVGEHGIAGALVRVAADADRKSFVVAEELLHVSDGDRTESFRDQPPHPLEARERISKAPLEVRGTGMWRAEEMVGMRDESSSLVFDFVRAF